METDASDASDAPDVSDTATDTGAAGTACETGYGLDDFYRDPLLEGIADIRTLPAGYTGEQAQADACFVIGAMVHNEDLFVDFMRCFDDGVPAFIRVAQTRGDGQYLMLTDILYDGGSVRLVSDTTRVLSLPEEERAVALSVYEGVSEYEYGGHLYWVAGSGTLSGDPYAAENACVIALIC